MAETLEDGREHWTKCSITVPAHSKHNAKHDIVMCCHKPTPQIQCVATKLQLLLHPCSKLTEHTIPMILSHVVDMCTQKHAWAKPSQTRGNRSCVLCSNITDICQSKLLQCHPKVVQGHQNQALMSKQKFLAISTNYSTLVPGVIFITFPIPCMCTSI